MDLQPTTDTSPPILLRADALSWSPCCCPEGVAPAETLPWERRDVVIRGAGGEPVFAQRDVRVPASWSGTAADVVVSRYLRGRVGELDREGDVGQLIDRVCATIARWGLEDGYLASEEDAAAFRDDLAWLCLHQHLSFNSPVWFNVGVEDQPQCSACFINGVEDSLDSILSLVKVEGMLFKWGSGAGVNLSPLRSAREPLKGGGAASGPVSFMRGYDAFAGAIRSGGKTRRAAKMVILDADHPDILEFIRCKAEEERKAQVLIDAGYDGGFGVPGGAYESVSFQNTNHTVRLTDAFLEAVEADGAWTTRAIRGGEAMDTLRARDLLDEIAQGTWVCGDPGVQFHDAINRWHTCPAAGPIRASNPCAEFHFLESSACNLASLNLMRFLDEAGAFQPERFGDAVRCALLAQEILVDRSSYPTPEIARNSRMYRPLGLGYANLGALLMASGLPYDSDAGRAYAAGITALMQGEAAATSARIAAVRGPFADFERNRGAMLGVMRRHRESASLLPRSLVAPALYAAAQERWEDALRLGERYGYRNAQLTALAPTGTISFMMDCDTTGIEPDLGLVKRRHLVGGGLLRLINRTVPAALRRLGYDAASQREILAHLEEHEAVEGAPGLRAEHLPVFDCAYPAPGGVRCISPRGHLQMMAAVQPFLSGGISKTVNAPNRATVPEIAGIYREAWRLGLKAVTVYRDGSRRTQPLQVGKAPVSVAPQPAGWPSRRKLPDTRRALTHKYSIAGHEGYITVGLYEDGAPGELFLVMAKEGSVVSGLVDAFATSVSLALQYGVPLPVLCEKFAHTRFEPAGLTGNPEIPFARSITDYIFRWLDLRFGQGAGAVVPAEGGAPEALSDAPPCATCGTIMTRAGTCYRCPNCGASGGCS